MLSTNDAVSGARRCWQATASRDWASGFPEADAIFATVSQQAIRNVALESTPPARLDHAFHLDRNVGQLSRTVDRGARSVNYCVSMAFNVFPTTLETA